MQAVAISLLCPGLSQGLVHSTYSEEVAEAADCLPEVYFPLVSMNRTLILFGAAMYQAKNIHLHNIFVARYGYMSQLWPTRWKKKYAGHLWEILT